MPTDELSDLQCRWNDYRDQRAAAGNLLDGTPDFDLQLYVKFEDRESECTILRPTNLKKFNDWRAHARNGEVVKQALAMIHELKREGKRHYSIDDLVGHFRHFESVQQTDAIYRINDHVGPLLARYCIYLNPPLRDFFELRSPTKRQIAQAITNALIDDADLVFMLDWDEAEWLEIGRQVRDELLGRSGSGKKQADIA